MYVEYTHPPIPAGFESVSAGPFTAVALTVPTGARYATIRVASANGRFRDDGTSPTSASGYRLIVDGEIELISRKQLDNFEFICASGDETVLEVLYYELSE